MTRTVLDGHGKRRVLTPENCTMNGHPQPHNADDFAYFYDWQHAKFIDNPTDPHVFVYSVMDFGVRVRGRRWTISALVEDPAP